MQSPPALVLFDIDGTLLRRAGQQHGEALVAAVARVTGRQTSIEGIPVQGMLDGDIVAAMLRSAGMDEAEAAAALPGIFDHAQTIYDETCPALEGKLCPSVHDALSLLADAGVVMGLVTGNLSRIAWRKMERAGITRFFRFGAFADMGSTRAELAGIAIRRARAEGWIAAETPVSLVGDHPNDVAAAKINGIRSIAVATGVVATSELALAQPDLLLPDLGALRLDMVTC